MINKLILIQFLIFLLLLGCSEEDSPVTIGKVPNIESINAADKWNPRLARKYKIEVSVNDPQGPDNIKTVIMDVKRDTSGLVIFTDSLYDDGAYYHSEDGDVIAGDGVYSNRFLPNEISNPLVPGLYLFRFMAIDHENNQSPDIDYLISFGENRPPEVVKVSAPDSFSVNAADGIIQATVSDSDGVEDVERVYFESQKTGSGQTRYEGELFNDGDPAHGDLVAGDSVFSTILAVPFLIGKSGMYNLIFHAEDTFDEVNEIPLIHEILLRNNAPDYSDLSVPSQITVPAEPGEYARELITIKVEDPEGLADIDQVYFYSLKPDTTFANYGQPIQLRDNGLPFNIYRAADEVGDAVAGDGIYSFSLVAWGDTSKTMLGEYKLTFHITDKAGNMVGPLERQLTIQ
jgi:hypothetical protein